MSIIGSCNSCLLEVDSNYKSVNCPECNRIYHENCWKKNDNKCSEYGCKGKKEIVEPDNSQDSSQSQTENLNNTNPNNNNSIISENNNFRKVKKNSQNKLVILLIVIIIFLLFFIAINFSKKSSNKVVSSDSVISTPSTNINIVVEPTPQKLIVNSDNNTSTQVTIEPTQTSESTPIPTTEPSLEQTPSPESTISESQIETLKKNNFNIDMSLDNYYTIQLASETSVEKAEKVSGLVTNSFIKAKSKTKNDKSKYYYVVVFGKFENENDAISYRKYVIENPSIVNSHKIFNGSFITKSSRLEDISVIVLSNPEPTPTPNDKVISNSSNMNLEIYYTVQIASEKKLEKAEVLSKRIPNSFVKIKSKSENDISDYFFVVVVGKFETENDAKEYRKFLITNYSDFGIDNISGSFIIKSSRLKDISDI